RARILVNRRHIFVLYVHVATLISRDAKCTECAHGPLRKDLPSARELLDQTSAIDLVHIGHIDVAAPVDCNAPWGRDLPLPYVFAFASKLLDPPVPVIGNVHEAVSVDRHALRIMELSVPRPERSPLVQESTRARELLDALIALVHHIHITA